MNRRRFLRIALVLLLVFSAGVASAQVVDSDGVRAVPIWYGSIDDRPEPGVAFFDGKTGRAIYVANDTGEIATINIGQTGWQPLDIHLSNYTELELPPTNAVEGNLYYNDDRETITWFDGDDMEVPTVGDDVLTQTNTAANTAAETEVYNASIDAGSMKVGRVYRVQLTGSYSTNDGSDTFTLRVHAGGVEIASIQSVADQVDGAPLSIRITVTVRSIDGSGSVMTHTEAVFNDMHMDQHHGISTVDTTQVNEINATVEWGVAEAGDSVSISQGYVEEIS